MYRPSFAAALLLAAAPAAPPAPPPPASVRPIVEAERAFAAMAQAQGSEAAFRAFVADDGQMLLAAPTRVKPLLDKGALKLGPIRWWPVYAGLAASRDLGFTTGPAIVGEGAGARHGYFFTIWRRQPDGTWRWIMDHGSRQDGAAEAGPAARVTALPAAKAPPRLRTDPWQSVLAAEAELARALSGDARAAYAERLAPDGRLLRSGPPPAVGRPAIRAAAAAQPASVAATHVGGAVSAAGDLAYTYGRAAWRDEAGERSGWYVRVWQRRPAGWTLVVDETNAPPPRRKPPGEG